MKMKQGVLLPVLSLVLLWAAVPAVDVLGQTPFGENSLVRQRCGACHKPDSQGKLEVIEETRKSPEEWKVVVDRMIRLNSAPVEDKEFNEVIKELSRYLRISIATRTANTEKYQLTTWRRASIRRVYGATHGQRSPPTETRLASGPRRESCTLRSIPPQFCR